jgi:hypothetical protein
VARTAERQRLHPVVPPAGWSYLLATGPADIYRHALADDRPVIEVLCDDDAGVIERGADVVLRDDRIIEWSRRVEALPGRVPENTAWTHDLLGIAAVFAAGSDANGRPEPSINWFWSATPQPEFDAFDCPVPGWTETQFPCAAGRLGSAGGGGSRARCRPTTKGSSVLPLPVSGRCGSSR